MRSDERDQHPLQSMRETYNLVTFLFQAWATCYWPFLRGDFGVEAFGVPGLVGLLLMVFYAGAQNSGAMLLYVVWWLLLVGIHRAKAVCAERRGGIVQHSRYDGWPRVALRLVPFVKRESTAKRKVEPFLCFVAGVLLMPLSQPLGAFVLGGFLAICGVEAAKTQVNRARLRQLRDAEIEMRQTAEQYRGWRNDL